MRRLEPAAHVRRIWVFVLAAAALLSGPIQPCGAVDEPRWHAGFARASITPPIPVALAGYAERTRPSESATQDIFVKALSLTDGNRNRALLITCDFIGFRRLITERICARIMAQSGLDRADILVNSSHTHSGPSQLLDLDDNPSLEPAIARDLLRYTEWLQDMVVETGLAALRNQVPVTLAHGVGHVSFPVNRREERGGRIVLGFNPIGPVDRSVPVLRINSGGGTVLGIVFGAACHNTTLPRDSLSISGDFAGYAQFSLERSYPGAQAMFVQGCGGDVGPSPTGKVKYAEDHGEELASSVRQVMGDPSMRIVNGPLSTRLSMASLPLLEPSREQIEQMANSPATWQRIAARQLLTKLKEGKEISTHYAAPIALWKFGQDLTLLAYSGEVVAEYAAIARGVFGSDNLWIAAYCNDVFGYLPTVRVLREGGYESRGLYAGRQFSPEVQSAVVETLRSLAGQPVGLDAP